MRVLKSFTILLLLFTISCNNAPDNQNASQVSEPSPQNLTAWTDAMKASIINDFEKGIDSTANIPIEDGALLEIYSYRNGQLKLKKTTTLDDLTIFEVFTAGASGEFELRRKYYPNGQMAYEGITLNDEHNGMDYWWHMNGQVEHQGLRFRSKNFGKWPYWKEDGSLIKEDNFGKMEYLDSLATINFTGRN